MDQALQTMIDNLPAKTGKSLTEWIELVNSQNFSKHGEIMNFLKNTHGMSHGFANLVAHKSRESNSETPPSDEDLVIAQYKNKEHFLPLYRALIAKVSQFGPDVKIAPKKTSVSLRRKKQFALLQPASKTRFTIGLNLKGQTTGTRLQAEKPNSMCSHRVDLASEAELDTELLKWLKTAYEQAG